MRPYDLDALAVAVGITLHQVGGHQRDTAPDGYVELARRLGVTRRWVQLLGHRGLTEVQADRYAVSVGLHPGSVWPELWWALCEEFEQPWALAS